MYDDGFYRTCPRCGRKELAEELADGMCRVCREQRQAATRAALFTKVERAVSNGVPLCEMLDALSTA